MNIKELITKIKVAWEIFNIDINIINIKGDQYEELM